MLIYVPSRARYQSHTLGRGTLKYVPKDQRASLVYVVPGDEVEKYERSFRTLGWKIRVLGVSSEYKGIAWTRYWIGQHAAGQGSQSFLMLDDDLKFYRRVNDAEAKLVYQDFEGGGNDWDHMLSDITEWLERCAVVGISPREGNNRLGAGGRYAPSLAQLNTRLLRAFAFRTDVFLGVQHGRVEVMEDFDVFLQIMRQGHDIVNLGYWSQDQAQTSAPGGCSVYRTHEVHEASAVKLAKMHEGFVKLRQKANKGGGAFGTRTEVTISWKKARESANA